MAASLDGLAWAAVSEVMAWTVSADHFRFFPFLAVARRRMTWMAWVACGKASPWATAVTFRVRCSRRPVTAAAGVAGDRHLAPGQGLELGVQAGLVAFDGEEVA